MGYEEKKEKLGLIYGIIDKPSWGSSILFGGQVGISCTDQQGKIFSAFSRCFLRDTWFANNYNKLSMYKR